METTLEAKLNQSSRTNTTLAIDERVRFMLSTPFFHGITEQDCNELAKVSRRRIYARDEVVAIQGQPFHTLMAIESGCVKLTQVNVSGDQVILALRGGKEIVHLPMGVPFSHHPASVQVLTGCIALTWPAEKLECAMRRLPRLNENVSRILASQLHELQGRYHDLAIEKVEVRLARLLIDLAPRFGEDSLQGRRLRVSRSELAQMTGTNLFTVSRLVASWGELGLVVPSRGAILVLKPTLLGNLVAHKELASSHIAHLPKQLSSAGVLTGERKARLS